MPYFVCYRDERKRVIPLSQTRFRRHAEKQIEEGIFDNYGELTIIRTGYESHMYNLLRSRLKEEAQREKNSRKEV